jgi:hypothetical protein
MRSQVINLDHAQIVLFHDTAVRRRHLWRGINEKTRNETNTSDARHNHATILTILTTTPKP